MKEAMFADQPLVEEDEEGEEESDDDQVVNGESQKNKEAGSENGSGENKDAKNDTAIAIEPEKPSEEAVQIPMYKLEVDEEGKVKGKVEDETVEEKVVTSMYGKVYKLKPGSATWYSFKII